MKASVVKDTEARRSEEDQQQSHGEAQHDAARRAWGPTGPARHQHFPKDGDPIGSPAENCGQGAANSSEGAGNWAVLGGSALLVLGCTAR